MTENQLTKLKNRLINVQAQLSGASVILSKNEPFINSKVNDANKLVAEALKMCETIKTHEPTQEQQERPKHKRLQMLKSCRRSTQDRYTTVLHYRMTQ